MNLVFDLGAVLIAWEPARLMQSHFPERAPAPEAAGALARAFFHHQDWFDFDCGIRSVDEVVERTAARLALPMDRVRALVAQLGERLEPIAENIALLAALRDRRDARGDLRLYFLSNMPTPYARALERRHAFFGWFDGGIFSGDVKLIKPDSDIYEMLAWRHGCTAQETLFIDDAAANVEAARALGWGAIHCTDPMALTGQVERYLALRSEAASAPEETPR